MSVSQLSLFSPNIMQFTREKALVLNEWQGNREKGKPILTSLYHFHLLYLHLDFS